MEGLIFWVDSQAVKAARQGWGGVACQTAGGKDTFKENSLASGVLTHRKCILALVLLKTNLNIAVHLLKRQEQHIMSTFACLW